MRYLLIGLILSTITGCGFPRGFNGESVHQTYSLDGVKLISDAYPNGNHPNTHSQSEYEVGPTRRLLLRYEMFQDQVGGVDIAGDKKVTFEIAVTSFAALADAQGALELCPVTRNWMMLASWYAPFYGPGGRWAKPGGDFDEPGCVRGTPKPKPMPDATAEPVLVFDVTRWFVDYARGRQENFGLILIAKANVKVVGDLSGTYSPRIRFNQF